MGVMFVILETYIHTSVSSIARRMYCTVGDAAHKCTTFLPIVKVVIVIGKFQILLKYSVAALDWLHRRHTLQETSMYTTAREEKPTT